MIAHWETTNHRMRHLSHSFYLLRSIASLLLGIILLTSCGKDPTVDPTPTDTNADGAVCTVKECTSDSNPVNVVIIGDGFIKDDYTSGGAFDQIVNRVINGLFSVEPFKTYSDYFKVQTVTAYSSERGATLKHSSIEANTIFEVTLEGSSSTEISGNDSKVFEYAKMAQGITATELKQTVVIVVSNYTQYAGTTYSYSDGRVISYLTVSGGSSQLTRFENVVLHEAGGHAFGRLSDEYFSYGSGSIRNDSKALMEVIEWQERGYNQNISLTPIHGSCPWYFIFDLPQYESDYSAVSTFEGAAQFAEGVWRSEWISCMDDNRPYFNAPSRVAIVKRIKEIAGENFSLDEFVDNDYDRFNTQVTTTSYTKTTDEEVGFVPLAPPVRIQ